MCAREPLSFWRANDPAAVILPRFCENGVVAKTSPRNVVRVLVIWSRYSRLPLLLISCAARSFFNNFPILRGRREKERRREKEGDTLLSPSRVSFPRASRSFSRLLRRIGKLLKKLLAATYTLTVHGAVLYPVVLKIPFFASA